MKPWLQLILGVISMFTFFSCRRNNSVSSNTTVSSIQYLALKPGNYWVYQEFDVDTNGNATPLNIFDSCYVASDTIINGRTFHTYRQPLSGGVNTYTTNYYTDSSGFAINIYGLIVLAVNDFTDTFKTLTYDNSANGSGTPLMHVTYSMVDKDKIFTVPAGTFKTRSYAIEYRESPAPNSYSVMRGLYYRYALNTGLVSYTNYYYSSSPDVFEDRLVRYRLN